MDLPRYESLRGTDTFKIAIPTLTEKQSISQCVLLSYTQYDPYTGAQSPIVETVDLTQVNLQLRMLTDQQKNINTQIQMITNFLADCAKAGQ
jgi:hypothetical protein